MDGALPDAEAVPDRVFHYTDRIGFAGILNSGEFWATDISYLNDSQELEHGRSLKAQFLAAAVESRRTRARRRIAQVQEILKELNHVPIYICCFSEDGDRLSQAGHAAPAQLTLEYVRGAEGTLKLVAKLGHDCGWVSKAVSKCTAGTAGCFQPFPVCIP